MCVHVTSLVVGCGLAVSKFLEFLSCSSKIPTFLENTVSKNFLSLSLTSGVRHSRNLPAMLCLDNSPKILTALVNWVSKYHRGNTRTVESARKAFYFANRFNRSGFTSVVLRNLDIIDNYCLLLVSASISKHFTTANRFRVRFPRISTW